MDPNHPIKGKVFQGLEGLQGLEGRGAKGLQAMKGLQAGLQKGLSGGFEKKGFLMKALKVILKNS